MNEQQELTEAWIEAREKADKAWIEAREKANKAGKA